MPYVSQHIEVSENQMFLSQFFVSFIVREIVHEDANSRKYIQRALFICEFDIDEEILEFDLMY